MFRGLACVLGLHGLEKSRDVAQGDRCGLAAQFVSIFLSIFLDTSRTISTPIDRISLADRRGLSSQIVSICLGNRRKRLAPID
jgi:hypothetical protein